MSFDEQSKFDVHRWGAFCLSHCVEGIIKKSNQVFSHCETKYSGALFWGYLKMPRGELFDSLEMLKFMNSVNGRAPRWYANPYGSSSTTKIDPPWRPNLYTIVIHICIFFYSFFVK